MALDNDEKELVNNVMEKVEDYYPPLIALVLYRYDKRNTAFGMPTEEIQKLVVESVEDLNVHSQTEQEGT